MDRCGLISLIFVWCVYVALASVQQYAIRLQSESARHPLRLLLFAAIAAACACMLAEVIHGAWFAHTGYSQVVAYFAGKFLKVLSKCLLMSMLMLLSQGICISKPLDAVNLWQVLKLLAPFFVACLFLEVWGEYSQSRTYSTGFIYCTYFGGALVFADLGFLVIYLQNLYSSYLAEFQVERQRFYRSWGVLCSCTFIVLPFSVLLSFVLSPWVRAETIFILTNAVHVAMLTSLVVGLWPDRAQTVFFFDDEALANTIGIKSDSYANLLESSPYRGTHPAKEAFELDQKDVAQCLSLA